MSNDDRDDEYTVAFNALTTALAAPDRFIPRSDREACTTAVLAALDQIGALCRHTDDPRHIIEFRADGWTIQHPLACRPRLFDCPVNRAAERDLVEPPDALGRFVCAVNEVGDRLLILDVIVGEAPGG